MVEEGQQVAGGVEPDRGGAGVVAVVLECFAGLFHQVTDAHVGHLEQVGEDFHRAHLTLIDQGEQDTVRVVEQWCDPQGAGGPASSATALLAVTLLGAGCSSRFRGWREVAAAVRRSAPG